MLIDNMKYAAFARIANMVLNWVSFGFNSLQKGIQNLRRGEMHYILRETKLKTRLWEMFNSEHFTSFQFQQNYQIAGAKFDFYSHSLGLAIIIQTNDMPESEMLYKKEVIAYQQLDSYMLHENSAEEDLKDLFMTIKRLKEMRNNKKQAVTDLLWNIITDTTDEPLEFYKDYRLAGITVDCYCPELKVVILICSTPYSLEFLTHLKNIIACKGLYHLVIGMRDPERDIVFAFRLIKGLKEKRDKELQNSENYVAGGMI